MAEQEEQITALAEKVAAEYGSLSDTDRVYPNPQIGSSCVAKFDEDENWYRARVKSIEGDKCDVLFVDYGNSATVSVSGLKAPTQELLGIPIMAVPCALKGVGQRNVTDELKTQFNNLIMEDEISAVFANSENNIFPVKLTNKLHYIL